MNEKIKILALNLKESYKIEFVEEEIDLLTSEVDIFESGNIEKDKNYMFLLELVISNLKNEIDLKIMNESILGFNEIFNMGIYYIELKLKYREKEFEISLKNSTYEKYEALHMEIVDHNVESKKELYELKIKMKNILLIFFNDIYWLEDTQNVKIAKELYSVVHQVENNYRAFFNVHLIKTYSFTWFKDLVSDEYQKKSVEYSKWYLENYLEFKDIRLELFNLQIKDLNLSLKNSTSKREWKKVYEHIEKIKNIEPNMERLKKIFTTNVINCENIWEKEKFEERLGDDFELSWNKFSKLRNEIAHNKLLTLKFQDEVEKLSKNLNDRIESGVDANKFIVKILGTKKNINGQRLKQNLKEEMIKKIEENMEFKPYSSHNEMSMVYEGKEYKFNLIEENQTMLMELFSDRKKEKDIEFYKIKILLKNALKEFYYGDSIYWLEDTQNNFWSTNLYVEINYIENKFRSLINNFMLKIEGIEWFNKKEEIYLCEENIEFQNINNELFSLLVEDLLDEMKKSKYKPKNFEILNKLEELKKEDSISKLEVLEISNFFNKSNFEVFFEKELVNKNFEIKWNRFIEIRNVIAHNKIICKEFYDDSLQNFRKVKEILKNIETYLEKKIKSYEDEEMQEWLENLKKEEEYIEEEFRCNEAEIETLPSEDDVIKKIEENEEYREFIEILNDITCYVKEEFEVLGEYIENVDLYNKNQHSNKTIIALIDFIKINNSRQSKLLKKFYQNILSEDEYEEFVELLEFELKKQKQYLKELSEKTFYREKFISEEYYLRIATLNDEVIEIESFGYLCPEKGGVDEIKFCLFINSKKIEDVEGIVEKHYGDYEEVDNSYYTPIASNELIINFKDIINELEKIKKERYEELENLNRILEEYDDD